MARIRTIKPEFPQSESMGRVSREARLMFIMLWTICDDEGRGRGNSRMLASLLFPYDIDAPELIDVWMAELEREGCVARFVGEDGAAYYASLNWKKHQRIDKPGKSRIPEPPLDIIREASKKAREASRSPREHSWLDQRKGSEEGIEDQRNSVGKPTGAEAPSKSPSGDDKTWLFNEGLSLIASEENPGAQKRARSLIGKWLKAVKDDPSKLRLIFEESAARDVAEPVAWITKAIEARKTDGAQPVLIAEDEHAQAVAYWRRRVARFKEDGFWIPAGSYKPDQAGCEAFGFVLAEFGYAASNGRPPLTSPTE